MSHTTGMENTALNSNTTWEQLSREITGAIERAGRWLVAVDGRAGHTSSGIAWRGDLVLSAAHTIRREANITIILAPGRSVQARLIGRDPSTDIAVLRLDREFEGDIAEWGTTTLALGALVVAVARTRRGNVVSSAGILGGLMGEWQAGRGGRIDQFIRPDLMLYPGFSGGALIGADGKVIGMNNGGLLRGRPITIPVSTLVRVGEELAAKGHIARPYIGLVMQPVHIPESLQKKAAVAANGGLLVMHAEPDGPADKAGVVVGDILVDLDGHTFDDLEDLQKVLGVRGANQELTATMIRGAQKLQLVIRVGERAAR
jgi:S1-C subfamily serine protease